MRAQVGKQFPPKKTIAVAMAKPEKRIVKREVKTPETNPTVESIREVAGAIGHRPKRWWKRATHCPRCWLHVTASLTAILLSKMREINPSIKDVDKIYIGDRISFPAE